MPVIAHSRPSGERCLMEDLFDAGGLPARLERIRGQLHTDALRVNRRRLGDNIPGGQASDEDVIRPLDRRSCAEGTLAVRRGNLAPDGGVIKPSAVAPHPLRHTGRMLVFDNCPSLKKATDDPGLDVSANDILALRYAGSLGGPGMPT